MGRIPLGILGLGGIGRHVVQLLLDERSGYELVGVASVDPAVVGRRVDQVLGSQKPCELIVSDSLSDVLAARPAVVIDASRSFLFEIFDDLLDCIEASAHVVSCCEELAFPFSKYPTDAERLDTAARRAGVTILGTGVNPGFLFDSLALAASGLAWNITAIQGRRVVDVSGFSEAIHKRLGIGYTAEEFEAGHQAGTIAGHVGFPESINMVVEGLGLELDGKVAERFEPLVATSPAATVYGHVQAGQTEGFRQIAVGNVKGEEFIRYELVLHLRPESAGLPVEDRVELQGRQPIRISVTPGVDALLATSAHLVNSCAIALSGSPGLKSVKDLPVASAWLGGLDKITSR